MSKTILLASRLCKSFSDAAGQRDVLSNISFSISEGELVAIMGASGSGKSTLLHILGGLDKPDSGEVMLLGKSFSTIDEKELCRMRNQHMGFVYQFHHLLPEFSAIENVAMPLFINNVSRKQALTNAFEALSAVGVSRQADHKISELSGGERQRVAIARAMVARPKCILADEPTGNLDSVNAEKIFQLMRSLQQEYQSSFVIVTHDASIAEQCDRKLEIVDGQIK